MVNLSKPGKDPLPPEQDRGFLRVFDRSTVILSRSRLVFFTPGAPRSAAHHPAMAAAALSQKRKLRGRTGQNFAIKVSRACRLANAAFQDIPNAQIAIRRSRESCAVDRWRLRLREKAARFRKSLLWLDDGLWLGVGNNLLASSFGLRSRPERSQRQAAGPMRALPPMVLI
jgi:hypothetical protein